MSDIRDDIKKDFEYLNRRAVKYDMALKLMESEHLPACFKPSIEHRKLLMVHTAVKSCLLWMQEALTEEEPRKCTECGKVMTSGYCIDDGAEYFCSDECLNGWYSEEEYDELCQQDRAYWTEWED